jgi:hypothetical protein
MISGFTISGNGKDRARHIKNEQQGDIFAAGNRTVSMRSALDVASS